MLDAATSEAAFKDKTDGVTNASQSKATNVWDRTFSEKSCVEKEAVDFLRERTRRERSCLI